MAVLRIPEENRTISGQGPVGEYLGKIGIDYAVWEPSHPLSSNASQEEILDAYSAEIEKLKAAGGYVTADVINVNPQTPNLDALLAKFSRTCGLVSPEPFHPVSGSGRSGSHRSNSSSHLPALALPDWVVLRSSSEMRAMVMGVR